MMPGRNGGRLRRGGPKKPKSALARQILEAATPDMARILIGFAKDEAVARPDRIKAADAVLARGGVPIRTELTGADGAPFTIAVKAALADGD
jgi:hypothetical protein